MKRRWLEPPRLRTAVLGDDGERHASWLELFFDLVFVVAVAQVASRLVHDHSLAGFEGFAALFAPVWWMWVGFTFYADRFDTDDVVFRVLMLAGMLAVGAVAVTIPDALEGGSAEFALAYVCARALVIVLYARAWLHVDRARLLITLYCSAFTVDAGLWLVSLAVEPPGRYWLWAAGLAVDMATPLVAGRLIARAPISASHIPERIGLLTIIVLGESVVAVVTGTAITDFTVRGVLAAICGFTVSAGIWWIYFDYLDSTVVRRSVLAGQAYLYGHLPLLVGLTAVGAGTKLAIKESGRSAYSDGTIWAVCGGVALCLLSMSLIHLLTTQGGLRDHDLWLRLAAVGAAVALGLLAGAPLVVMPLLALALVGLVAVEIAGHEGHVRTAGGEPAPSLDEAAGTP
jgi:low temperature requirement protein LtrA